jgi:hypothetical protein
MHGRQRQPPSRLLEVFNHLAQRVDAAGVAVLDCGGVRRLKIGAQFWFVAAASSSWRSML